MAAPRAGAIALDARKAWDGGIGTYIRRLLGALCTADPARDWIALVDPADAGTVRWPGAVRETPVRARKYGLSEHWAIPAAARSAGAALLHAPHYTLPLGWTAPSVVTVHDLIHVRHPRFFAPGASLYARAMAGAAVRRATVTIADSEHTRSEIVALLGADPARVRVVPLGVSAAIRRRAPEEVEAVRQARGLPSGYVLYVGARKRHKNLALLLEALALIPPVDRPPLVLSGTPWAAGDPLARLAARLGIARDVRFAGDLRDEDALAAVYSGAALYVQPSLDEGFGLPPLEAMACGTPVLCSNAGALPEAVGQAAVLLPPRDPGAWAAEIVRLLADAVLKRTRSAAGLERARSLTWERAAAATLAIYEEALAACAGAGRR